MKRFGQPLACIFLGSVIVGCGGGLEEGTSKEVPQTSQTAESKSFMEQNSKNMTSLKQGKPKDIAAPAK
jgi:hypothetical protein